MAEADFNDDGEVSYEEFIPLAVDLVQSMYAKMEADAAKKADEDDAREEAKNYLLHGMTKEQVESVMMEIFSKSDADGNGQLSVQEFQKCCKDADIGLTRKEINILMHQCDVDGDGFISYEEFIPLCFEMLTEILKDELLAEKRTSTELEEYLKEVFAEADHQGTGLLSPSQLKEVIRGADFGLSRLQIHSVLSAGDFDEDGLCDYGKFAQTAAELIYRMLDADMQMERAEAIQALTVGGTDFSIVHGYGEGDVHAILLNELKAKDTGSIGVLSYSDVQVVLSSSQLGLEQQEVQALLTSGEQDASGMINYESMASYAFYILQYMAQNASVY